MAAEQPVSALTAGDNVRESVVWCRNAVSLTFNMEAVLWQHMQSHDAASPLVQLLQHFWALASLEEVRRVYETDGAAGRAATHFPPPPPPA